ncbi:MAG: isopenicillin N synthase family oxygenase [Proteobacteria bacterium]|nr:isopenicillin N synthase family oxygenase [Pseudomonadota bacterium]
MSHGAATEPNPAETPGIPIIDIGALAEPRSAAAAATARSLCRAYETLGFAYIADHGVPQPLIDAAFAASAAFHAAPLARKQSVAINEFHRGYMAFAGSTVVTSTVARNTKPNLSESFLIMHELAPDDPDLLARKPLQGPNQWPGWLPEFRPTMQAYVAALDAVAQRLLHAFTIGLALPQDYLAPLFAKPTMFLRLLHYPPHPLEAPDDQFGSAPHTDFGCMTILAQDSTGGLQVRRPGGTWIEAPPIPGTFVLNLGDLMPRWSNDRFKSTPHRVINRSRGHRYSMPYFFDPGMDAIIECLPGCAGAGNPPRHAPLRYGDYLMERIDKNYHYRKVLTAGS